MTAVDLKFERTVLDGLGRLLLTSADKAKASTALLGVKERLDEVSTVAYKHKVTPIVAKNARDLADSADTAVAGLARNLAERLADDDDKAMAHRALLVAEVVRLAPVLNARGCLIKGFCNARFYPLGYTRWMRDLDLYCRTWADALELMDLLRAQGYSLDLDEVAWVKADPNRGRSAYGQIFLVRPMGSDFCRVDIHFGTYSVGYAGYLDAPIEDLIDDMALDQTTVKVLSARLIPLMAQAHALSDGYVAAKDINDFVSLAVNTTLDWTSIGRELAAYQLQPQAALLARHVLRLYDHPLVVSAAQRLLSGTGTPRLSLWQTHNRSWGLRAAVNASFAARWRVRQSGTPSSAVVDATRCYLFYRRRLHLAVRAPDTRERLLRRLMASPGIRQWQLRPDACLMLVDAESLMELMPSAPYAAGHPCVPVADPLEGVRVLLVGTTTIVALRDRVFLPTLDLIIDPRDAQAALMAGAVAGAAP